MKKHYRIMIILAVIISLLGSGCSSKKSSSQNRDAAYSEDVYYDFAVEEAAEVMMDYAYADGDASAYSKAVPAAANDDSGTQKRMIQKSASINIQVMDPIDASDKLTAYTENLGGFVVSCSTSQERYSADVYLPKAYMTIRVPAEYLNETLDFIENLTGDSSKYVSNKNVFGQDITAEYVDTNSRLTSLETTRDKLYEIMGTAQDAEEALAVYMEISSVESDIEVLKGQVKYMEQSVALSSIDVQISSIRPAPIQTVSGWNIGDVIKDAFETLLDGAKSVIEFVIYFIIVVIPILILIALPIVLIVFVIRMVIRSKKNRKGAAAPAKKEDVLTEVRKE